jgi:hypothetical protein
MAIIENLFDNMHYLKSFDGTFTSFYEYKSIFANNKLVKSIENLGSFDRTSTIVKITFINSESIEIII